MLFGDDLKLFFRPIVWLGTLGAAIYIAVGWVLYNQLSMIDGGYGLDRANSPAHIVFLDQYPTFNTQPYLVRSFQPVRFLSRASDLELSGWWMPQKEVTFSRFPTVIVTHGYRSSKASAQLLVVCGMLWHAGFNVLALDLRDHGLSEKEDSRTALGTDEYLDILGAVDWLNSMGMDMSKVGLVAPSLGGAAALNAFGKEPKIKALFLDSPVTDIMAVVRDELEKANYPTWFAYSGILMGFLVSSDRLWTPKPLEALHTANGRRLFVMHYVDDTVVSIRHSEFLVRRAQEIANSKIEFWFHRYPGHGNVMLTHPEEYRRRLIRFFDHLK